MAIDGDTSTKSVTREGVTSWWMATFRSFARVKYVKLHLNRYAYENDEYRMLKVYFEVNPSAAIFQKSFKSYVKTMFYEFIFAHLPTARVIL